MNSELEIKKVRELGTIKSGTMGVDLTFHRIVGIETETHHQKGTYPTDVRHIRIIMEDSHGNRTHHDITLFPKTDAEAKQ
jgi:hypothetical protein